MTKHIYLCVYWCVVFLFTCTLNLLVLNRRMKDLPKHLTFAFLDKGPKHKCCPCIEKITKNRTQPTFLQKYHQTYPMSCLQIFQVNNEFDKLFVFISKPKCFSPSSWISIRSTGIKFRIFVKCTSFSYISRWFLVIH